MSVRLIVTQGERTVEELLLPPPVIAELGVPIVLADGSEIEVRVEFDPPVIPMETS